MRSYALFALVTAVGLLGNRAAADEQALRQFFQAHCIDCHGTQTQEGGLRLDVLGLDSLAADFAAPASFAVWVKIHDRLHDGTMPPKDSPQPPASERQRVVAWLGTQLTEADMAGRRAEGRAVLRRLNRTEYE